MAELLFITPQEMASGTILSGNIDVDKLFTHTWSLDQAKEAYELFDLQSDGKGVFVPK